MYQRGVNLIENDFDVKQRTLRYLLTEINHLETKKNNAEIEATVKHIQVTIDGMNEIYNLLTNHNKK